MKLKRKLYSEAKNRESAKKERFAKIKQGINYAKTHTFKETATAAGKGIGRYAKNNPDEFIVLGSSNAIPLGLGFYAKKKGKGKLAGAIAATSMLPIGEGYIAAKKGIQATIKKKKEAKAKQFSDREKVPSDIAKEGKKSGVIQKDKKGKWRIISYKTNPPEFWNAHYDTKEDAEKALGAYHANK